MMEMEDSLEPIVLDNLIEEQEEEEEEVPIEIPSNWMNLASFYPSVSCNTCHLWFLFVGLNGDLMHVSSEKISFDELSFSFLHACLRRACSSFPNFKLVETLVFNFDLEHDEVIPFLESEDVESIIQNHLHSLPFLNDVVLQSSAIEFHSSNALYFILNEKELAKKPKIQFFDDSVPLEDSYLNVQDSRIHRTKKYYSEINENSPTNKTWLRKTRKLFRKN